jgi:hypothetical protein
MERNLLTHRIATEFHLVAAHPISNKHIHPGAMAASEWKRSVRAVRDIPVLQQLTIAGNTCAQPTMFPTLHICTATAAGARLTCTNFEMEYKLPLFSGMVISARAYQFSTTAPSLIRCLILNCHCSCHGKRPFKRTITPPRALLYPDPVIRSIPSAPALASSASIHLRYTFTV